MIRWVWVLLLAGAVAGGYAFMGSEDEAAPDPSAPPIVSRVDPHTGDPTPDGMPVIPDGTKTCAQCHRERQPGIMAGWDAGEHSRQGVKCEDCHGADHEQIFAEKGRVPASRCAQCHEKQTEEFLNSSHANARTNALKNARLLAQIPAMQRRGCMGCHDLGGGEEGRCNACHGAHRHSAADARRPEACGTCHMGPDHPHIEAWEASPHGVAYGATGDTKQAPTCASCHMPRGTHDASAGITLGRSGSGAVLKGEKAPIPMHEIDAETARTQRDVMVKRCAECHTPARARAALDDADRIKREADRLVARAVEIMEALYAEKLITPAPEDRPAHPTLGHALVLGGQMLYENQSNAERIFFDMAKFAHAITFKAAYHQAADHMHWLGNARLKADLVELEAEARRLRAGK